MAEGAASNDPDVLARRQAAEEAARRNAQLRQESDNLVRRVLEVRNDPMLFRSAGLDKRLRLAALNLIEDAEDARRRSEIEATQRQNAEHSLQESESRLKEALEAGRMATWDWDPETDQLKASKTAEELFGLRPGETLNHTAKTLRLVHPDDAPRYRATIDNAMRHGRGWHGEFRIIRPRDSKVVWLEERAHATRGLTGKLRLSGIVWDVTDRKRAETALRQSEERLRNVLNSMDEAFVVKEPVLDERGEIADWRYVECNPAFIRQTGVSNPLNRRVREVFPDVERRWIERYTQVLKTGRPIRFQDYYEPMKRWLDVFASRIGSPEGHRVALVFTDITERKSSEESLQTSEARLRLILESAREYAIFSCDLERRVTTWSNGAERLLGFTEAEITGQTADIIFVPEDRAKGAPEHEARGALIDGRAADERWHLRKNGERFWGSGVLMLMREASGSAVGTGKVRRDETETKRQTEALASSRQRLEEALAETERARAEAENANQAKDIFLAALSHELRTPLTPVLMTVESLLRQPNLAPRTRKGLELIARNVELETHFINDLLDLTRISRGKLELLHEPVELHGVVRAALEVCAGDIQSREQNLSVNLRASGTEVTGDSPRLQQVLWNLLKNASKFTPKGGQIEIDSWNEPGKILVRVKDNGIGIEREKLNEVFEPFRQASAAITQKYGGLGLGLAISKATVEQLGGAILAESAGPGRGAAFTVSLPLATSGGKAENQAQIG